MAVAIPLVLASSGLAVLWLRPVPGLVRSLSGVWQHIVLAGGPSPRALLAAEEYAFAHTRSSKSPDAPTLRRRPYLQTRATHDALRLRYYCASARLSTIRYSVTDDTPGADLRLNIVYRAPLRIPGPARWLSDRRFAPWEIEIRSYAILLNEAPDTRDRTLGMNYRSATNHLIGELHAIVVLHLALGGRPCGWF